MQFKSAGLLAVLSLGLVMSCAGPKEQAATTIRLTDLAAPSSSATDREPRPSEPTTDQLRFIDENTSWRVVAGVSEARRSDGRLHGSTTSDFPILGFEWRGNTPAGEPLHSIEISMRSSASGKVGVSFVGDPAVPAEQVINAAKMFPWRLESDVSASESLQTVLIEVPNNAPYTPRAGGFRGLMLRPTTAAGAQFELESVRLVFAGDHLREIPEGLSWQGLGGVFHESLVTHSPGNLSFEVVPPMDSWLDVSFGYIGPGKANFEVALVPTDGAELTLTRQTLEQAGIWQHAAVDLKEHGGRRVKLELRFQGERDTQVGLWGSPALRQRATTSKDISSSPPKGVILIITDTLRRDHLDSYGYSRETAPALAQLAAGGVRFDQCIAQSTWTKPSVPSILTGLHPLTHGLLDFSDRLSPAVETLAEVYRHAGYATVSFSSVAFTGAFSNLHQGFEELHEASSLVERRSSKTSKELVPRTLEWLQRHGESPFFVLLHVFDPHDPYEPRPPFNQKWVGAEQAEKHRQLARDLRAHIGDPLLRAWGLATSEEFAKAGINDGEFLATEVGWYDGSIREMDHYLGQLFSGLTAQGLDRDVVVAVVSDHGEEFLEHGRMHHGQSVFGELANVPMILWGPRFLAAGKRVGETVQTIDLMPTLLELSRLPLPEAVQGASLLPLLGSARGAEPWRNRPAFTFKAATSDVFGPVPRDQEALAIAFDDWKLVRRVVRPGAEPELMLFDLKADPLDQVNLLSAHPEIAERLKRMLEAWHQGLPRVETWNARSGIESLSPKEVERLRSLGYL